MFYNAGKIKIKKKIQNRMLLSNHDNIILKWKKMNADHWIYNQKIVVKS